MTMTGIEDIYELTPLQEGMLFHTLYTPESAVYNIQLDLALEGMLDTDALEQAWRSLVERYAPLRTSFVWERVEKPYQVVLRHADLKIALHDWRNLNSAEQIELRRSFLKEDCAQLFDLAKPPLMRLALMVLSERRYQLVWTFHHIILEGWSAAILLSELWKRYDDPCGRDVLLSCRPFRPYVEYIHWLRKQDQSKATAYWRETFKNFNAPTRLPIDHSLANALAEVRKVDMCSITFTKEFSDALKGIGRTHRVTLNTVVQGAWAILLSRYCGAPDVVFGAVVSGSTCRAGRCRYHSWAIRKHLAGTGQDRRRCATHAVVARTSARPGRDASGPSTVL